jgi:hypothetical protein
LRYVFPDPTVALSAKQTFISTAANVSKVRTADLYAKCSEGPVSALHVEMCMVQHLSLRGFLAFTAIGTNVRTSLISPPA